MVSPISPAGSSPVAPSTPAAQSVRAQSTPALAPVPAGDLVAAVAQVNQHLAQTQSDLKLQMDADSGRTVIQVIHQGSGQVLLQVPSEEVLGMSRRVRELLNKNSGPGTLVDKEG